MVFSTICCCLLIDFAIVAAVVIASITDNASKLSRLVTVTQASCSSQASHNLVDHTGIASDR